MNTCGKEVCMRRIFKEDGKTVISALDMGLFAGVAQGLEDVRAITKAVVDAGADAIIVSPGWARATADIYGGKCALIVRVTGGLTKYSVNHLDHSLICSVEEAVALAEDHLPQMEAAAAFSCNGEHSEILFGEAC